MSQSEVGGYEPPKVERYGSVESVTKDNDKIGSADDGVDFQGLDGDIQPDS
jgi:hypothetical protein